MLFLRVTKCCRHLRTCCCRKISPTLAMLHYMLIGQSKGFCYVSYATREGAAAAMEALNGVEYPQHCGQRMKVFVKPIAT